MEEITALVKQIANAPAWLLVIIVLNVIGFVLKGIDVIPNKLIPLILVALGGFSMWWLGGNSLVNPEVENPWRWLVVQGIIFGFAAWALHGMFLKKLETYIPGFKEQTRPPTPEEKKL